MPTRSETDAGEQTCEMSQRWHNSERMVPVNRTDPIVELAVDYAVPSIREAVMEVRRMKEDLVLDILWSFECDSTD